MHRLIVERVAALDTKPTTSVHDLLNLVGADREAKAYAFLYAAFKKTEVSANPVRDALDCFIPFIVPHLNTIAGQQVTSIGIQQFLRDSFGFDLPLYAIDQLMSVLLQQGYVDFRKPARVYIAKRNSGGFDIAKSEIETEFDYIVDQLEHYAESVGFQLKPPPSGSWGQALLNFLRARPEKTSASIKTIKNAIIDSSKAELAVVAAFVRRIHDDGERWLGLFEQFPGQR